MNPFKFRKYQKLAETSQKLDMYLAKRCVFCDMDMGVGQDVLVAEFIEHLLTKHKDKLTEEQYGEFHRLLFDLNGKL